MESRLLAIEAIVLAGALTVNVAAQLVKMDFDADAVGTAPKQFALALTGQGRPGVWVIRKDDQAHGNALDTAGAEPLRDFFPQAALVSLQHDLLD